MSEDVRTVPWTEALSVDVRLIDDEHKVLLSVFNDLVGSIEHRDPRSVADKVLHELFAYTRYHFGHEEELMTRLAYPEVEEHRRQHARFVSRVLELQTGLDGRQVNLRALAEFVHHWILDHIQVTDRELGVFLKDRLADGEFEFDPPPVGVIP